MYKNTGRKIKGFSIFFAWAFIAAACLFAFYRLFSGKMDAENIMISIGIIVGGSLIGLFASWFMYGFGVIVEKNEKMSDDLETVILTVDELSSKLDNPKPIKEFKNNNDKNSEEDIPLENFKLPDSREELFRSQMKKLKKDYEMSRITYDEYESGKRKLEQKYR